MEKLLTVPESQRLRSLEVVISKGKNMFMEVGCALAEIRDSKLYRTTHKSFEDYCREKWGWSKTHCNRLIEASAVVADLAPIGVKVTSESQARELARVEPERRVEVVTKAKEKADAEQRSMTARDITEAAAQKAEVFDLVPEPEPSYQEPPRVIAEPIEDYKGSGNISLPTKSEALSRVQAIWVAASVIEREEIREWINEQ